MFGNKFSRKRGSISVYLSIVIGALVLFCSLFFSIAQYDTGEKAVKSLNTMIVRNTLQGYDLELYEKYGLRAINKTVAKERLENLFALNYNEYLTKSFHFDIKSKDYSFSNSLNDNEVLKKYMIKHVKEDLIEGQIKKIMDVIDNLFSDSQCMGLIKQAFSADVEVLKDAEKSLKEFSVDVLDSFHGLDFLLLDHYLLTHFENNEVPEVEEIITGIDNTAGVIAILTSIRFVTNLGYFLMSPSFMSKATAYATALAGATVVGVPVAKAGIIFAWCMAEAAIDVYCLMDGMKVPLIKTERMWTISESNFIEKGAEILGNMGKKLIKEEVKKGKSEIENVVEDLEGRLNSVLDSVKDTYNSWIDEALKPILEERDNIKEECKNSLQNAMRQLNFNIPVIDDLIEDKLAELLDELDENFFSGKIDAIREKLDEKVEEILLEPIRSKIESLKEKLYEKLDKGEEKVYEFIDEAIGKGSDESMKVVKGSGIMLGYEDYLRIFLLITPEKEKLNRSKLIIQRNLPSLELENSYTQIALKMNIDLKMILIGKRVRMGDVYEKAY